jgi:acetyltransferase
VREYFEPRSIAVLGATESEGKMGNRVLRALEAFPGRVYPVHPSAGEIGGHTAYPGLAELPEPVDLLLAAVPAARLLEAVEAAPAGCARYLASIPAGFGEASPEGAELERRLVAATRARGIRVVGPNIFGVINGPYGMNASMIPTLPPAAAGFSLLTQSGGFAMNVWMYALTHDFPVAKMCDLGNTSDVGVSDVLGYFRDDADTSVVGLFLESVRDTAHVESELERLSAEKHVLLTLIGRTEPGRRASVAHLGIDTKPFAVPPRVLRPRTGQELLNVAKALAWQPSPRGRRVGIVTGTGGVGTEASDLCVEHGLEVPALTRALQARLGAALPEFAPVANPVDLTPIWQRFPELYPQLIEELAQSGEVDLLIVTVTDVPTALPEMAEAIASLPPQGVPVYVFWGAHPAGAGGMRLAQRGRVPCYPTLLETVRVAAALADHAEAA